MNTIKIKQQIKSNDIHIEGLDKYKGRNAEIIILIEESAKDDPKSRRKRARKIIASYTGKIQRWNRDELYDR